MDAYGKAYASLAKGIIKAIAIIVTIILFSIYFMKIEVRKQQEKQQENYNKYQTEKIKKQGLKCTQNGIVFILVDYSKINQYEIVNNKSGQVFKKAECLLN